MAWTFAFHAVNVSGPVKHGRSFFLCDLGRRGLRRRPAIDGHAVLEAQVIGDGRAIGGGVLRVVAHLVEHDETGAEAEGFGDVMGDHEDGHAGLAPDRQQQRLHVGADAGV